MSLKVTPMSVGRGRTWNAHGDAGSGLVRPSWALWGEGAQQRATLPKGIAHEVDRRPDVSQGGVGSCVRVTPHQEAMPREGRPPRG